MKQEDRELLYKDLCARLPYGVCYKHFTWDDERGEECIAAKIYSINSICTPNYVPTALDVYRGKTTLDITYRDSVAIDSVVVYKVK